jgi:hypothetical protein
MSVHRSVMPLDWLDAPALEERLERDFSALGVTVLIAYLMPGYRVQLRMDGQWRGFRDFPGPSISERPLLGVNAYVRLVARRRCQYIEEGA